MDPKTLVPGSFITDEIHLYEVKALRFVNNGSRRMFVLEDSSIWADGEDGERIYSEKPFTEDEVAVMRLLDPAQAEIAA